MLNYKTVEEKASEWNISPRHIQFLCRSGKIENAVKRAGSWFIPEHEPSPAKYSKSDDKRFHFVGTKSKIFHSAIELFMQKGFDSVSLQDIGSSVGIRQSTIYNHFKSKQEILDTIYDFYCYHYLEGRPSLEQMEERLKDSSLMEIIEGIRYDFKKEYMQEMSDITKIIFQRMGIDSRAKEIAKSLMLTAGVKYVEDIFNKGIEIGRFSPFNTSTVALLINSVRVFTLFNWIVDPSLENFAKLVEDERELYQHGTKYIEDLGAPK